jgi:acyl-CoA synthetase (AMP-forming)/AMP-acid ligase II
VITSPQSRIDEYTKKGWWGNKTLHGLLSDNVARFPQNLAVADQTNRSDFDGNRCQRLSFTELGTAACGLSEQLLLAGIKCGDKVIVQLPNIAELVATYYALSQIGAIVSPVPIQYGRHELSGIQSSLKADHLISIERFGKLRLADKARELPIKVLSFAEDNSGAGLTINSASTNLATLNKHREKHADIINDANRILTICWTSGTTGTPKGVPRSHNMWLSTTQAIIDACEYKDHDALLNPFPLINMAAIGGFLFPAALHACALHLHHPFEPTVYLQQLQNEKINFTIAPPAVLNQLAKTPDMWNAFDFSHLRCVGSGSAPLAPWMIETFSTKYGKEVVNFYGSNEGICLLANEQIAPTPEQRASMFPRLGADGIPWQGDVYEFAKTKVADPETGAIITASGEAGELLINGPTIFDGYYGPQSDDEVFSVDGYFRTGDLVEICGQPAHYYKIVGRCKDIINRGGVKISPTELDQLLEGFTGLQEAAVCAYKDPRLGEKVCACVVLSDALEPPTLEQITAYLDQLGVAKYKLPERLEVFEHLPRNPMNKVLRFELSDAVNQRQSNA